MVVRHPEDRASEDELERLIFTEEQTEGKSVVIRYVKNARSRGIVLSFVSM